MKAYFKEKAMKKRIEYVDIAKGIGILLVVFCHIMSKNDIYNIIYMFHMPLFFFLSGITFNENNKFYVFVKKKFKSILIPYYFFSIISFIYWIMIERNIRNQFNISIINNFINIFICQVKNELYTPNIVLWFLPCLFISSIIVYSLLRRKNTILNSIILLLLGYCLCVNKIILPFTLETAFIAQFFIICGYYYNKLEKSQKINFVYLFISLILFIISLIYNSEINMLSHNYGNLIFFIMGSLSGIYIVIFICKMIKRSYILEKIGYMSLLIMCCHEPLKRIVIKLLSLILNNSVDIIRANYLTSVIVLIIVIAFIFPFNYIINKYFPIIVGRNK